MSDTKNMLNTVNAWFDSHADEVVRTAQDLIKIPSVNPKFDPEASPGGEANVQEYISSRLAESGIESSVTEGLPGRPNLHTAVDPEAPRTLVFNGHIDVVPVGDTATWHTDPFGGEIAGDRLFGRGAVDMKGGVASALTAIRALQECGFAQQHALAFHSVVDEEAGGAGTRALLSQFSAPTAVIVSEPTDEEIQTTEGGLEWVRVTLRGQNGHSAWRYADLYPQRIGDPLEEMNVNVIDLVSDLTREIRQLEWDWAMTRRHPLLPPGFTTISPGVLRAGSGIGADGLPLLYDNPAMIPDTAVIDFDIKFFPGEESTVRQEFESCVLRWAARHPWLRTHTPTFEWELKGVWFPSMDTPADDPIVQALSQAVTSQNRPATISGFPAVADAAFYSHAGAASLIYGPTGAGLHGPDEWVSIRSLRNVSRSLALTAVRYLSGDSLT